MLEAHGIGYRTGKRWLVRHVDFSVRRGTVAAIAGPNGAGKSTLLRLVSGELRRSSGRIQIDGHDVSRIDPLELARFRAMLAQTRRIDVPFSAFEVVMLGRFPHLTHRRAGPRDDAVVRDAMARTGATSLHDQEATTLSGGERGRVDLARVLAQQPSLFLLDEPTHHLDLRYQIETLELCRSLATDGHAVVIVLHDLNLMSLYADHMLLMKDGRAVATGTPAEVLTERRIVEVFDIECRIWTHPLGCPWVVPCPRRNDGVAHEHPNNQLTRVHPRGMAERARATPATQP